MLATNYLTSLFIHLLWLNYLAKYMTMHASTLFIHITTRCIWAPISGVDRGTMQFIYFTMQIKECITSQRRRWWSGRRPSASRRTGLTHDVLSCHHISVHGRAQLLGVVADPGTAGGCKRGCLACWRRRSRHRGWRQASLPALSVLAGLLWSRALGRENQFSLGTWDGFLASTFGMRKRGMLIEEGKTSLLES